ncbi:hypothetical protein E0W68_09860 [Flavobacterium salilacus subsp. salilacus]|uniref:hypothetical protein n=1 Tax=Flavobacterium TaxID=237 RepID=UPI0010758C33|nr:MULTISPECIES: hypothetical protein [Flavobacterium]KAF2518317.1 hypothetical protein E0W68_09860 [Flavobacterium salilacus subsp. salilacus]MBE1615269.1 hypothetical protein [Flavobacterium sp. SaA2.13]
MKQFLLLLCLTVFTLANSQEKIELYAFGFSMEAPKEWFTQESEDDLRENLNRLDLTPELKDVFLKNLSEKGTYMAFYKYDFKKYSGIIPTINLIIKKINGKNYEHFKKVLEATEKKYPEIIKNYKTVSIKDIMISGNKAIQIVNTYNIADATGREADLRSISTYFYRGNYYIKLILIEEIGKENNTEVYETVLKSIDLTID